MAVFYDSAGNKLSLGPKLGEGGEGAVFEIEGRAEFVAKIYHKPVAPKKADKLRLMASVHSEKLLKLSSWPVDVLNTPHNIAVQGLVMPRISGYKPIHELYSPRSRRLEFPQAHWPFLVHAAANVARAFAAIHEHGHVIGDVNHGNVVVSSNALVKLIDCDSFQITGKGTRFHCEVGVPEYTPAELQGKDFSVAIRTPNHDAFGLAVLMFHLLFLGRHPFAGRYTGPDYMPIERAIREYRFAYGKEAPLKKMLAPPHTLPLGFVSAPVAELFERAFAHSAAEFNTRPKATEWVDALGQLAAQIRTCGRTEAHAFYNGLAACPWCELEKKLGIDLFIMARPLMQGGVFELQVIWNRIQQVQRPETVTVPAAPVLQPSAAAQKTKSGFTLNRILPFVVGAISFILAAFLSNTGLTLVLVTINLLLIAYTYTRNQAVRKKFEEEYTQALTLDSALRKEWETYADDARFTQALHSLELAKRDYIDLPNYRQKELQKLNGRLRELQLEKYLENYRLRDTKIENIGTERMVMLLSYGIETAADVVKAKVKKVPGFGKVLTQRLLDWRAELEKQFVFNPYKGLEPRDLARLDRQVADRKKNLETQLSTGPSQLTQIREEIRIARQRILPRLTDAQQKLAQAEADRVFLGL